MKTLKILCLDLYVILLIKLSSFALQTKVWYFFALLLLFYIKEHQKNIDLLVALLLTQKNH